MTDKVSILWADDENRFTETALIFLREKGYEVVTTTNGNDALVQFAQNSLISFFLTKICRGFRALKP
jgi:CheY-like chemotaxis protein